MKRIGARLGFLAPSVLFFYFGWYFTSLAFFVCASIGYFRTCGIARNLWIGFLPYKFWSNTKPSNYNSYKSHLGKRIKTSIRFLFCRESLSDISEQDSWQVSFRDFFASQAEQSQIMQDDNSKDENEFSYLYNGWKEGDPNAWKNK